MQGVSRIYLDTNIFIMAFERRDETSDRLAQLLAAGDADAEPRFVTSELTLSELLVTPYRQNDDSLIDAYEGLILTSSWLEVLPIVPPTLRYAAVLRSQYGSLKLPDAIHLSTAIGANCSHILTDDRGIKDEYRLTHQRYGRTAEARPLTILRPDEPTLSSLLKSLVE
ncbi:PIN domain-containing protein [Rhizobium leguminosarum]|uniref:type II toxin-antitoxin system VapC family toxin n=1 Tax=Rhizobium leguminosarum TaxID=384 RepID=UPI001C969FEF|nr:PIN domain-containing protein [Rhizobium leguminosarum]MBY5652961.1 PIN domain-containing protein [Rhizobium leguminosarum]MBY5706245.1 PIN domain-containing protein [Rhizobium leguminosarum]MBY5809066.1 PIN domain-containing protein [Rhizobium leguminosarum]